MESPQLAHVLDSRAISSHELLGHSGQGAVEYLVGWPKRQHLTLTRKSQYGWLWLDNPTIINFKLEVMSTEG